MWTLAAMRRHPDEEEGLAYSLSSHKARLCVCRPRPHVQCRLRKASMQLGMHACSRAGINIQRTATSQWAHCLLLQRGPRASKPQGSAGHCTQKVSTLPPPDPRAPRLLWERGCLPTPSASLRLYHLILATMLCTRSQVRAQNRVTHCRLPSHSPAHMQQGFQPPCTAMPIRAAVAPHTIPPAPCPPGASAAGPQRNTGAGAIPSVPTTILQLPFIHQKCSCPQGHVP